MDCMHCGKPIDENAAVCPYCGKRNSLANTRNELFGRLGMVLSLVALIPVTVFLSLPGIVFSAIGLKKAVRAHTKKKNALVGLIAGSVAIVLYSVLFAFFF